MTTQDQASARLIWVGFGGMTVCTILAILTLEMAGAIGKVLCPLFAMGVVAFALVAIIGIWSPKWQPAKGGDQ